MSLQALGRHELCYGLSAEPASRWPSMTADGFATGSGPRTGDGRVLELFGIRAIAGRRVVFVPSIALSYVSCRCPAWLLPRGPGVRSGASSMYIRFTTAARSSPSKSTPTLSTPRSFYPFDTVPRPRRFLRHLYASARIIPLPPPPPHLPRRASRRNHRYVPYMRRCSSIGSFTRYDVQFCFDFMSMVCVYVYRPSM
ncbi:hypothetical protein MKEN_00461700 [Mycena kentingensis (nom. inval.)]|nr:hypothetical protein MKEN_00461700 [Mycena kentingensis (nom. inval.)]